MNSQDRSAQTSLRQPLERSLDRLDEQGASLLVLREERILFRSDGRGVGPLLRAMDELADERLADTVVIDRIVGKAAAALIVCMGAGAVAAGTLSHGAAEVLERHRVPFVALHHVARILNRSGDASCPFESAVEAIDDPSEAHRCIRDRMASLKSERV